MYEALKAALEQTGIPMAEGDWDRAPQSGSYIAVRLDSEGDSLWGDQHQQEQALEGSVHLFERSGDKANMQLIQSVLDGLELSWRLNSVQHEARNHIVHYEWVFQLEVL